MNERIREHLVRHNEIKKWGITDEDLIETVVDADSVWEGVREEHRWYTMVPTVVCIDGMFLIFNKCHVRGENSDVDDCIGGYELKNIVEAEPEEILVTVYKVKTK